MRRVSFRYPDRRTGFDRREAGTTARSRLLEAYRRTPAAVAVVAVAIALLAAADVALTRHLIAHGASEVNPVMAALFAGGDGGAVALKAAVTIPVAASVWLLRRYRRVLEFSLVVLAASAALVAYEVVLALSV